MQLSSRILTALAVLILAVAVVAVRAGSPGTVEAATGTINVINVGTCYTTDTDVFNAGDCDDGDAAEEGYKVAERETAKKVDTVFATYAIDPKTSGEEPRAILINSDVIKINIEDKGRDKRTGKLYAVGTTAPEVVTFGTDQISTFQGVFNEDELNELMVDTDSDGVKDAIRLSSDAAYFTRVQGVDEVGGAIGTSGDAQFRLTDGPSGTTRDSTKFPMAPDGKVFWFGIAEDTATLAVEDVQRPKW